jgi:putative phosphonate metabolism protein
MAHPRYAIYFTPPRDNCVCQFGSAALGYDAFTGQLLPFPASLTNACPDWRGLTDEPRKYGFHATFKAPFALAAGRSESELVAACRAFSRAPRPFATIRPVVRSLGDFIALVPDAPSPALDAFAQACVEAFDDFRSPLTEAERARRNPAQLSPRQRASLDRWGYPHVLEDFRFHMTLTGRVPEVQRGRIADLLRAEFAACDVECLAIDRIAIFCQNEPAARFRIIAEFPLQAAGDAR